MAGGAINDMSANFSEWAEQHSTWFPPSLDERRKLNGSPLQLSQSSPIGVIPTCDAWPSAPLVSTIWRLPLSPPALPCYGIPSRPIAANQAEDAAQRAMRMAYVEQLQDLAGPGTSNLGNPRSRSAAWRAQALAEEALIRAEAGVKAARAAQAQAQAHAQAHETQQSLAHAWTQAWGNAKAKARKASLEALLDAAVEGQAEAEALLAARR